MPPRRRSSRLHNASPAKSFNHASMQLSSLAERDELSTGGAQSNPDYNVSSPFNPRTPTTGRAKPSSKEMHPSKAHQSTTKEPDSGLRFGFVNIDKNGDNMPSGVTQKTPSKTGFSSTFDFQFARPAPEFTPAAQKIRDELREEALRIKVQLAAEQEEKKRNEENSVVAGRKMAQPKGKAGRYSDVHMAEFKKMDSIAGHASSFRAQPDRLVAAKPSLKRSQSKANLNDRAEIEVKPSLKRSQSTAKLSGSEEDDSNDMFKAKIGSERLENTAPAKRARQNITDDTSSARPVSRGDTSKATPSTPDIARSQSNVFASLTTPTKASLARSATSIHPATQIPTLFKSTSKPNLVGTPRGLTQSKTTSSIASVPQSEPKSFLRSPGKLERVKSMLRYPSSSKKPTITSSSIPALVRSPSKPNLEKVLPAVPTTPILERSKTVKHVNFTPDTVYKNAAATIPNSPSPHKSAIPRSASKFNLAAKTQTDVHTTSATTQEVRLQSVATLHELPTVSRSVEYPSLAGVRPLPEPPRQVKPKPDLPACVPGTFNFRSDHTIQFGQSPKGFGSSPGQSSVRQVRQSLFPSIMPGAFSESNGSNKENKAPKVPLSSVPHGMSNKKRRRVDSDDEEEPERNGSPAKKQKSNTTEGAMPMAPTLLAEKTLSTPVISSPTKKKVLTLSRLNMLSRPKNRK